MAGISKIFGYFAVVLLFCACEEDRTLPIYGNRDFDDSGDTLYHKIPSFEFINQDEILVTQEDYDGKIYIADFFFTTCPGICPIMTDGLKSVQDFCKEEKLEVKILSHTVDPETDYSAVMKAYGIRKGADFTTWDFVTGDKKDLYKMAEHYLVVANEDPNTEIHFVHSDKLVLIDAQSRIRGMYNGTDREEVDQLKADLKVLIKELDGK